MPIGGYRDEFDDLKALSGETGACRLARSTEASIEAARAITTVLGPYAPVIDRYLEALSYAPADHLALLAYRGARIIFAPTIDAFLTGKCAEQRRGRPLTSQEAREIRIGYGPESGAVGVYDSATDALVFPTGYCSKDLKQVVLHELGHALTLQRAQLRTVLILGLPFRLHRHVYAEHYSGATEEETLRQRVLEALAEGYIYVVDGQIDRLPDALASELTFMLQTVEDGNKFRFEFEKTPDGERTASRATGREILDPADPESGHLFADMRLDPSAEAWDLAADQLSVWRRKQRRVA